MKGLTKILLGAAVLGICLGDVPGGYAGAFLSLPKAASAVGVGGACITFDPEPAALFDNPANLATMRLICAQASLEKLPLAAERYSLAVSVPWGRFRFGAGYIQHSVGEITGRDATGNETESFSHRSYAAVFAAGYTAESRKRLKLPCRTSIWQVGFGASFRVLGQKFSLEGSKAETGYSVDFGASGRYWLWRWGILLKNALGRMNWADDSHSIPPWSVVFGVGVEYCESDWFEGSVEIISKAKGRLRWRFGGQYLVRRWCALRAGIDFYTGTPPASDELRIAAGGAVFQTLLGMPLELSFALQYIAAIKGFGASSAISWNTFSP